MAVRVRLGPGTVIGRDYRLVRPLAKGGMGAVYVAEQVSTGIERALKIMHPQLLDDDKSRERFTQEARVCARIDSDHVVTILGAGVDDDLGAPWIAMELLKGESLGEVAKARGKLPAAEVLEIFRQLCHGLGAAHDLGIVHRDLKLENIFIARAARNNVPFNVKVLDFGIAKVVEESQADSTAAIGSPMWMAPEQARKGRITPATDVWALGLVAFRLLSGKVYWKSANAPNPPVRAILVELMVQPIAPASVRAKELECDVALPPSFDAWLARCLERDPTARFQSAREALEALEQSLGAPAPAAAPPDEEEDEVEDESPTLMEPPGFLGGVGPSVLRRRPDAGPPADAPRGDSIEPVTARGFDASGETELPLPEREPLPAVEDDPDARTVLASSPAASEAAVERPTSPDRPAALESPAPPAKPRAPVVLEKPATPAKPAAEPEPPRPRGMVLGLVGLLVLLAGVVVAVLMRGR